MSDRDVIKLKLLEILMALSYLVDFVVGVVSLPTIKAASVLLW